MSDRKVSARDIIMDWNAKYANRFYDRPNQLHELFTNLKLHGYSTKDDITPTILKLIVKLMHNEEWKTAKKWKSAVESDLDIIMRQHYPTVEIVPANPDDVVLKQVTLERPIPGLGEERLLDTKKLREGIEFQVLEEDELRATLCVKKDGR